MPGEKNLQRSSLLLIVFLFWQVYTAMSLERLDPDENRIDSLMLLSTQENLSDSLLMDVYMHIGLAYRSQRPSMALKYSQKALALAEQLDYELIRGNAIAEVAYLQWRLGRFDEALHMLVDAGDIFLKHNDLSGYARVLNTRGALYSEKGHRPRALEDFYVALKLLEEIDSIARTGAILNNIAMIYMWHEDYETAEQYHLRALAVREEFDDQQGIAFSLNNLGVIQQNKGEYDEALEFFLMSLAIRKELNDYRGIAAVNRNIGSLYFELQQFDKAAEHYRIARSTYEAAEDLSGIVQADHYLGKVYTETGDLALAQQYIEQSLRLSEDIGLSAYTILNYDALGRVMAAKGNYYDAYRFKEMHRELRDSLFDAESRRQIIEMQVMHERELSENELELLRRERQINQLNLEKQRLFRNLLLITIAIVLTAFFIIYNRFLAYKKINKILLAQKKEITNYNNMLKDLNNSLLNQKEKVEELNQKLRHSQKALKALNETKDKFFSLISHDLRSPFAAIISFSRIMKRDIDDLSREELVELTRELDKSVQKINSLLDNLLQWSRSQTGKIRYEPREFRLKEIISENINLFAANAGEKGVEVLDDVDSKMMVYGDMKMIDAILRNLLSNALKYTERGGTVRLTSRTNNGMIEISVADTGVGISEEDQQKLFSPDTLHSTFGTRDEKGSGLGLILCKEFVNKHGGNIFLKSKVGEGSVFSFTIPQKNPSS